MKNNHIGHIELLRKEEKGNWKSLFPNFRKEERENTHRAPFFPPALGRLFPFPHFFFLFTYVSYVFKDINR